MIKKLKIKFLVWLAPWFITNYREAMLTTMQKACDIQMDHVLGILEEANNNNLDIYIEMNPKMADNMVKFATGRTEQPDEEKENPFSLVEVEDEEE